MKKPEAPKDPHMLTNSGAATVLDSPVFFVDADNTLWGTDAVFAEAQERLLDRVEEACAASANMPNRLHFIREVDQALAERHHLSLKYPPVLLAQALALALAGDPPDRAAVSVWRESSSGPLQPEVAEDISTVSGVCAPRGFSLTV
jgi:putative hydrolase of the HAD superfamily